jgi:hypothetical protein
MRVALFLALHSVASLGQLSRYAYEGDLRAAEGDVRAMERRGWVGVVADHELPPGLDAGRVDVYYLERAGVRWLSRRLRGEGHRRGVLFRARWGRPEGRRLATLSHSLVQGEFYLQVHRDRVVHRYVTERELLCLREAVGRDPKFYHLCATPIGVPGDKLPDGILQVSERGEPIRSDYFYAGAYDRTLSEIAFEVQITSGAARVASKPPNLTWVVCHPGTALRVARSRGGEDVVRITSVTGHAWDCPGGGAPHDHAELWRRVEELGDECLTEIFSAVEFSGGLAARVAVAVRTARDAVLIYPRPLSEPFDEHVGGTRVRGLTFSVADDLDEAGRLFLRDLLGG